MSSGVARPPMIGGLLFIHEAWQLILIIINKSAVVHVYDKMILRLPSLAINVSIN